LTESIRKEELLKEEESWQNQRKEHLKKVQEDIDEIESRNYSVTDLCDYLFEKHPPRHNKDYQQKKPSFKDDTSAANKKANKKSLQKLVTLYHPDRINKESHGMEYFVLCEEITKILNGLYTIEKGVSD
jgi:hypothetical protein